MGAVEWLDENGINLVDKLVGEEYRMCYEIATTLYKEETAIQACCATLMIQYAQIRKSNVKLKEALDAVESILAKGGSGDSDAERAVTAGLAKRIYAPLIKVYPKAGEFLSEVLKNREWSSIDDIDERMKDYMTRNHIGFEFDCRLSVIENKEKC